MRNFGEKVKLDNTQLYEGDIFYFDDSIYIWDSNLSRGINFFDPSRSIMDFEACTGNYVANHRPNTNAELKNGSVFTSRQQVGKEVTVTIFDIWTYIKGGEIVNLAHGISHIDTFTKSNEIWYIGEVAFPQKREITPPIWRNFIASLPDLV